MNASRLRFNLGDLDRLFRVLLGLALGFIHWEFNMLPAMWLALALVLTAVIRFCPVYALFNWDSLDLDPSKTVIPWEEFLDMLPPPVPVKEQAPEALMKPKRQLEPVVAPVAFHLPPELTQALIKDIEKNALDEMLVVRFFENFFGCRVTVVPVGHLHSYSCKFTDHTVSFDFAKLKATLLARLKETRLAA
jgi:hypothetical protein